MKKLLLILLCLPMIGFGQGWETTFGGTDSDGGASVQQTTDGGYIITGSKNSFGNDTTDVYLIKTDGSGVEQWSKTYGGSNDDAGYSVQQTTDGGYIITGSTQDAVNGRADIWLIKTNGNGDTLWTKTFGGPEDLEIGKSVQQTTDGGYIITGNGVSGPLGDSDVNLIKTDGNGIEQWTKNFGASDGDWGASVQQTTDGGYIITGSIQPFPFTDPNGYVYLLKTDNQGNIQWEQFLDFSLTNSAFYNVGSSVQQTTDGGYIITGYTQIFDIVGSVNRDVFLIKTDGNGDSLWTKTLGGSNDDAGYSVQQTTDGGYIITGSTQSFGNGGSDIWLIKTDGNGDTLWAKTFGGSDDDYGLSVQQTTDGGYIIAGVTSSFGNGENDVYLIKTDGSGNITSTFNIPINPNRKLQKTVDILGRETKPKPNIPFIEIYDDGTVEKRIVIE